MVFAQAVSVTSALFIVLAAVVCARECIRPRSTAISSSPERMLISVRVLSKAFFWWSDTEEDFWHASLSTLGRLF